MGEGEPGGGRQSERGGELMAHAQVTIDYLKQWEEHGAVWRALEVSDDRAVIELRSCFGEPVDLVDSDAPALIEFVRAHPRSDI
jgi:hypothetical protein